MRDAALKPTVQTKRIFEYPEEADGLRVLITRYWPRGISRDAVDEYVQDLAPSRALLHAYRDGQLDWPRYRHQFRIEMQEERARKQIHRLANAARSTTVTLCPAFERNQAEVVPTTPAPRTSIFMLLPA